VLRALEEHGAVWRGAQRQERVAERYRGAEYERELPVVRLEVWVPDATARAAALALADAAGVDAQDRSRVWLEPVGDGGAVGIDAVRPDYRWAG
jgi:nitrogen regulatory protein PII